MPTLVAGQIVATHRAAHQGTNGLVAVTSILVLAIPDSCAFEPCLRASDCSRRIRLMSLPVLDWRIMMSWLRVFLCIQQLQVLDSI